jgi:hypothetical protein
MWTLNEDAKLYEGAKLREDTKLCGSYVKMRSCLEAV